jgi:RNA polymerase sigma-70 factor (ECF subfamily)
MHTPTAEAVGPPSAAPPPDFEELYATNFTSLVQLYAYFGDRQETQDVAQEAFCPGQLRRRSAGRRGGACR